MHYSARPKYTTRSPARSTQPDARITACVSHHGLALFRRRRIASSAQKRHSISVAEVFARISMALIGFVSSSPLPQHHPRFLGEASKVRTVCAPTQAEPCAMRCPIAHDRILNARNALKINAKKSPLTGFCCNFFCAFSTRSHATTRPVLTVRRRGGTNLPHGKEGVNWRHGKHKTGIAWCLDR